MGNACSSNRTQSDKDVSHRRPPADATQRRRRRVAKPASAANELHADGDVAADINVNTAVDDEGEAEGEFVDSEDEYDHHHVEGRDEDQEAIGGEDAEGDNLLERIKSSSLPWVLLGAGVLFFGRKWLLTGDGSGGAEWATDSAHRMAGVESEQISANYSPGCVKGSLATLKTITRDNDQKNASKGAISGNEKLHKSYAKEYNYTPPRVLHHHWAAEPPYAVISPSETIRNYRFTRLFGW